MKMNKNYTIEPIATERETNEGFTFDINPTNIEIAEKVNELIAHNMLLQARIDKLEALMDATPSVTKKLDEVKDGQ